MQILKGNCIGWREKKLIRNCTYISVLNSDWPKERQEMRILEGILDMEAVCRQFYLTVTANTLPRKFLKGLETSK
jgi:hypothetical protein